MTVRNGAQVTTADGRLEIFGGQARIEGVTARWNGIGRDFGGPNSGATIPAQAEVLLYSEIAEDTDAVQAAELALDLPSPQHSGLKIHGTVTLRGQDARIISTNPSVDSFGLVIDGGTLIIEAGATFMARVIQVRNGGTIDVRSGGRLIVKSTTVVGGGISLQGAEDQLITEEGAYIEARLISQSGRDVTIDNTFHVERVSVDSGYRITGSGTIIGRSDGTLNSLGFSIFSDTSFEPTPPGITLYSDVRFRPDSRYVVNINGFELGQYGRTKVYGVLQSQRNNSGTLPRLDLVFDDAVEIVPNQALSIFEVLPGVDEDGQPVPNTGRFALSNEGRFFHRHSIWVINLPGFKRYNGAGINPRYQDMAPGGVFIGQLGDYDLFVFDLAGDDENHYTVAFLDGRVPFENGFPPPDRVFNDRFHAVSE